MPKKPTDLTLLVLQKIQQDLAVMRSDVHGIALDVQTLVSRTGATDERVTEHESRLKRIEEHLHL